MTLISFRDKFTGDQDGTASIEVPPGPTFVRVAAAADVPTPGAGAVLFVDPNTGVLSQKGQNGLVSAVAAETLQTVGASNAAASVGPFVSTDYWLGATAAGGDMTDGHSVVVLFEFRQNGGTTSESIVCWGQSGTLTGWWLVPTVTGATASIQFGSPSGPGTLAGTIAPGWHCVAVSAVSNTLRISLDGAPAVQLAASNIIIANQSTARMAVGGAGGIFGAFPAVSFRLLEFAHINASLSDADLALASGCVNADNRYQISTQFSAHASLGTGLQIVRDWAGIATTMTPGAGSVKPVLSKQGATKSIYNMIPSETIYAPTRGSWSDNGRYDAQSGYVLKTQRALLRLATANLAKISVELQNTFNDANSGIGVLPNGVYATKLMQSVGLQTIDYTIPVGTAFLDLRESPQSSANPDIPAGTFITRIRANSSGSLRCLGSVITPNRVVLYQDSISWALASSTWDKSWPMLMRANAGPLWGMSEEAWSGRALATDVSVDNATAEPGRLATLVTRLTGMCTGSNNKIVLFMGTNDWASGVSSAAFATLYAALVDAIIAARPDVTILCVSPTTRTGENATMVAYRTAIAAIVTARPSARIAYVSGPSLVDAANLQDGLHPNNAGHAQLESMIRPYLGY